MSKSSIHFWWSWENAWRSSWCTEAICRFHRTSERCWVQEGYLHPVGVSCLLSCIYTLFKYILAPCNNYAN